LSGKLCEASSAWRRESDGPSEHQSAVIFAIIHCDPLPPQAAPHYARLKIHCQRHGLALDENDFWIAATAIATNAVLVTRDKDFNNVPGLTLQDWSV
jgi:predicted nucleic acid-binding protein